MDNVVVDSQRPSGVDNRQQMRVGEDAAHPAPVVAVNAERDDSLATVRKNKVGDDHIVQKIKKEVLKLFGCELNLERNIFDQYDLIQFQTNESLTSFAQGNRSLTILVLL